MRQNTRKVSIRALVAAVIAAASLLMTMAMPFGTAAQSASSDWSAPRTVYIPETGHTLDQLFLDMWRNAGGANAYGYPITNEITESNGHVVQYLQYARFEYWPEGDADGNTAFVANLGDELRPMAVQRTVGTFSSQQSKTSSALDTARQIQAWFPVSASKFNLDDGSVYYSETTKHAVQHGFLDYWQNVIGSSYLGEPLTEEYTLNGVTYQVFERGQLAWTQEKDTWLVPVGQLLADKYKLNQAATDQGDAPTYSEDLFVPPPAPVASTPGGDCVDAELWVDVNLSSQSMDVYCGDQVILSTLVSTGRPGFETPTGEFFVNSKLPSQTMEGVIGGEYYNVPDVPDVMYFTDEGHALHGAYWHNNFGNVMSHGCVNLPMDVADWLYSIAPVGMRVEIHY
ncbi:MAG TPA: L,D-transpeptidase [Thermomicrobiales bacterium]|nr:L,D-transpeptidase [Thermomicrobiales bacterium]